MAWSPLIELSERIWMFSPGRTSTAPSGPGMNSCAWAAAAAWVEATVSSARPPPQAAAAKASASPTKPIFCILMFSIPPAT